MIYKEITYRGRIIEIHTDDYPSNPLDNMDFLGKIAHSSDYILCKKEERIQSFVSFLKELLDFEDEKIYSIANKLGVYYDSPKVLDALLTRFSKKYIWLPIHIYDHSGITVNTTGFNCRFDSGQIGIIYVSKENVRKEWNVKRISETLFSKVEQNLKSTIELLDNYLTGESFGYIVKDGDDELDSCWGFFGDDFENNGLLDYAQNSIDCEINQLTAV